MGLNRSNIFFFPVCPLFCNWLLLAECYRNVVPQVGVGGGSERCWAMEGYGEARIELSGLTSVFKGDPSLLRSRSLFPECTMLWGTGTETS